MQPITFTGHQLNLLGLVGRTGPWRLVFIRGILDQASRRLRFEHNFDIYIDLHRSTYSWLIFSTVFHLVPWTGQIAWACNSKWSCSNVNLERIAWTECVSYFNTCTRVGKCEFPFTLHQIIGPLFLLECLLWLIISTQNWQWLHTSGIVCSHRNQECSTFYAQIIAYMDSEIGCTRLYWASKQSGCFKMGFSKKWSIAQNPRAFICSSNRIFSCDLSHFLAIPLNRVFT